MQASQLCPAICAKLCAPDCPVRCCHLPPPIPLPQSPPSAPLYCPQVCLTTCVSSCPTQCCSNVQQGVISSPSSMMVRSKIVCPAICSKLCFWRCPKKCCNVQNKENITKARTWSLAVKGKFDFPGLKKHSFKTTRAVTFAENSCFKLMMKSI